jgi:hypothetical protein
VTLIGLLVFMAIAGFAKGWYDSAQMRARAEREDRPLRPEDWYSHWSAK